MNATLLLVYAALSLGFWMYSLYHLMTATRKRERWMNSADLVVLGVVGLLSSAAWLVLLPVYAAGWMMSGEAQRLRSRVRELGRSRGAEAVTGGRPAHLRAL